MTEILRLSIDEVRYSVRLLQKFGSPDPYLTAEKIRDIWIQYSQHDTLFSDYTEGKVKPFLEMLLNPRAIIAEVFDMEDEIPIGALMLTSVIPNFDAMAHFTLWDSKGRGREPVFIAMMNLWMDEFNLHRLSVEVPKPQSGVIRFIQRLGFTQEGIRREGTIHTGKWLDLVMFGILRTEVQDHFKGE